VVLIEVLVSALRRVEEEHGRGFGGRGGLHLFVGGIFVRVRDLSEFAVLADMDEALPGADKECGESGEEDVAVDG
jgi:hypothetical protein